MADEPAKRRRPKKGQVTSIDALSLSVIVPVYNERHLVRHSLARLLALDDPLIASLEVVIVDDHSTDGSYEIVRELAEGDSRIKLLRHPQNSGKGAAVVTGIRHVTGHVTVVHDADLEYNPEDIPRLLLPFVEAGADAVYGSRYFSAQYRRALMYRHSTMNRWLTGLSNLLTDLDLTDVETCYKAIRTSLLKTIPIRSTDFRFEVEITSKLAKRRARVFEVPIRYSPRGYHEGKKIRPRDGVLALTGMLKYWLIDDVFARDVYGPESLQRMDRTRRSNIWLADTIRPYVGERVLELGAGLATITNQLIPRERYVAADVEPETLSYLHSYRRGKPYLEVRALDGSHEGEFDDLKGMFDTVLAINLVEHVQDPTCVLKNVFQALEPGGRAILLVPQSEWLFGSLDKALGHRARYTRAMLRGLLEDAGFSVVQQIDFNRSAVPGWLVNGKLLPQKRLTPLQLKIMDTLTPVLRRIDDRIPWAGQSLIAVAQRP